MPSALCWANGVPPLDTLFRKKKIIFLKLPREARDGAPEGGCAPRDRRENAERFVLGGRLRPLCFSQLAMD